MLTLTDVCYTYPKGNQPVLQGISAEFHPGNVYMIVGKSGSGKTTLLSLLSGLDQAGSGEILYDGESLATLDRDVYRAQKIGVIFQGYNLLHNMTAVENIVLSMEISGVKEKDKKSLAYGLLENVGIDRERANRKILKLSGGEQQRVGIARALSHNPSVIIADEPTGNLDEETEEEILMLLQDLAKKENRCVIIVTHSQKVSSYGDQVYGMNQGVLLFIK